MNCLLAMSYRTWLDVEEKINNKKQNHASPETKEKKTSKWTRIKLGRALFIYTGLKLSLWTVVRACT